MNASVESTKPQPFRPDADDYWTSALCGDEPALLINPQASTSKLLAVAMARLQRHQYILDLLSVSKPEVAPSMQELTVNLKAGVDEVIALLDVISVRGYVQGGKNESV